MKKIFVVFVGITFFIMITRTNIVNAISITDDERHKFTLNVINENETMYCEEKFEMIEKYKTLWISVDEILPKIFNNYDLKSEKQTLEIENVLLEIDKRKNTIKIPNIYYIDSALIDDSVDIEIEEFQGIKYVPIYLIVNMPMIQISIDNKIIEDESIYLNNEEILRSKDKHSMEIIIDNSLITNDSEKNSLWRKEAYKRIEKYKKSDIDIIIKNQNERTLKNVNIDLLMNNNQFKFGTAVRSNNNNTNNYEGIQRDLFNILGSENGFKWTMLNSKENAIPNSIISYAKLNNMYTRGHCLWWDYVWETL